MLTKVFDALRKLLTKKKKKKVKFNNNLKNYNKLWDYFLKFSEEY